jgi:hypothetical protein
MSLGRSDERSAVACAFYSNKGTVSRSLLKLKYVGELYKWSSSGRIGKIISDIRHIPHGSKVLQTRGRRDGWFESRLVHFA